MGTVKVVRITLRAHGQAPHTARAQQTPAAHGLYRHCSMDLEDETCLPHCPPELPSPFPPAARDSSPTKLTCPGLQRALPPGPVLVLSISPAFSQEGPS